METVDHPDLPLCVRLKVEWHWFWFRNLWYAVTGSHRARWAGIWHMKTRGANYTQVWVGPVTVIRRAPWLAGPARQLHPELFSSSNPEKAE